MSQNESNKCDFSGRPGHVEDDCRQKREKQVNKVEISSATIVRIMTMDCEKVTMLCKEQAVKSKSSGATMYKNC